MRRFCALDEIEEIEEVEEDKSRRHSLARIDDGTRHLSGSLTFFATFKFFQFRCWRAIINFAHKLVAIRLDRDQN